MEELEELRQRMLTERPAPWDQLPDLALYMDQIISYMPRQLIRFGDGDALTAAMVNNYTKDGLLPRAEGKRYGREHLAWLTAICALKPVISMREMSTLFRAADGEAGDREAEERYGVLRSELDRALTKVAQSLDAKTGEGELAALALRLALDSYASKLACQRVLDIIEAKEPAHEENKKKK